MTGSPHILVTSAQLGQTLQAILARRPAAIAAEQAQLPSGFSEHVAETVVSGFVRAAAVFEATAE